MSQPSTILCAYRLSWFCFLTICLRYAEHKQLLHRIHAWYGRQARWHDGPSPTIYPMRYCIHEIRLCSRYEIAICMRINLVYDEEKKGKHVRFQSFSMRMDWTLRYMRVLLCDNFEVICVYMMYFDPS